MTRLCVGLLALTLHAIVTAPAAARPGAAETVPEDSDLRELAATLEHVRTRNAQEHALAVPPGIDEARFVEIGGIPQWVTIRGEDRMNPVLLFLHGGPGDATNLWSYAFFRPWLEHFTVVQWDQRGAGRTLGRNGSEVASTLTLQRLVLDGIELAEWLRESLGEKKIVLVGHSAGSIVGILMAKARPELFHAYVGTGQVADPSSSYAVAHAALLEKAKAVGDQRAVSELREIGPPPYPDGRGYAVQRRWSNWFEGADVFLASTLGLALGSPGYTVGDVNDWLQGQGLSAESLVPETSGLDAKALAGDFAVPVLVIQGAEDFTTPTSLASSWLGAIRAPTKVFVAIENGGHFAVFLRSEVFLDELVSRVLPLTAPDR